MRSDEYSSPYKSRTEHPQLAQRVNSQRERISGNSILVIVLQLTHRPHCCVKGKGERGNAMLLPPPVPAPVGLHQLLVDPSHAHHTRNLAQADQARGALRTALKGADWSAAVQASQEYLGYLAAILACLEADDLVVRYDPGNPRTPLVPSLSPRPALTHSLPHSLVPMEKLAVLDPTQKGQSPPRHIAVVVKPPPSLFFTLVCAPDQHAAPPTGTPN